MQNVPRRTISEINNVPRGTLFENYAALLVKWNQAINLVAKTTIDDLFVRHIEDSAQLYTLLDPEDVVVDLGSGAGLPGVILSYMGVREVYLVESDKRKAAFLHEASRISPNKVTIINDRIENVTHLQPTVITARALAPLTKLLEFAVNIGFTKKCLFLKGKNYQSEIDEAQIKYNFKYNVYNSTTENNSCILEIREIKKL